MTPTEQKPFRAPAATLHPRLPKPPSVKGQAVPAGFLVDEGVQVSCGRSETVQLNILLPRRLGNSRRLLEELQE